MARTIRIVFFSVLSLLIICFIFSNSLPSIPESRETSLSVAALLRPLLDPHRRMEDETFHVLIRKIAHFVEFSALGVSLTGLSAQFERKRRYLFGTPAVGAVFVAFCDEGLQFFTGRGNSIIDVLIDSAGAFCGVLFVAAICWLQSLRKLGGSD